MSEKPKRVAVIGAGVGGLSALRNLTNTSKKYIPTCFERGNEVGGVWVYNKNTHIDENGLPVFTNMYRDLITNIPKQLMAFPDFSYQPGPSYISRPDACDYLQRYAEKYDLRKYIKMNMFVQTVRPNGKESDTKWTVSYFDVRKKDEVHQEVFDIVIVCSGHHEKPYMPEINGLDKFKGEVLHSHNYRIPEYFQDKKVVILGASFSGQDLAVGISPYGERVFLSHVKDPLLTVLPPKVVEKPGIKHMTESGVVFLDDTREEADVLIFCTGYRTHYPFLSEDVVQINCQRVTPIYKHFVHIKFRTLFFVGIPKLLDCFAHSFEITRAIVAILNGNVVLPSEDQMSADADNDFAERKKEGLNDSQAHFMGDGDRQWRFNKDLAKMAGLEPLPTCLQRLWDYVNVQRDNFFLTFRKQNFEIVDSEKFVEIQF